MRNLDWDGYFNARDLGGLPTRHSATGATILGRLARGPRRELITRQGWEDARAWGLSGVVDLRCDYETGARDGDPDPGPAATAGIQVAHAPAEDHSDPEFRRVCFPLLDSPAAWPHTWRILPGLVRHSLEAIAHAGPGVLVHCSAGRDRTGMISTLLLGHAGVSPEDVAHDYTQSVVAMVGATTHAPTFDRQAQWTPERLQAWISRSAPIVSEIAAETQTVFDSIGLGSETRRTLRAMLTREPRAGGY